MLKNGVVAIWFPDGGATPWVIHLCSAIRAESSSSNTPMLSGSVPPLKGTPNTQFGGGRLGTSRAIVPPS